MTVIIVLASIVVLLMIYCRFETKWLRLTSYTVSSEKVPDDLDGRRIILLSDLHNTYFGRNNIRLIQMIEKASPDLMIIAGDLINGRSTTGQFRYASDLLECLSKMNIPVYYAYGNHECRLEGCRNNEGAYRKYTEICAKYANLLNNSFLKLQQYSNPGPEKENGTKLTGLVLPQSQFRPEAKHRLETPVSRLIGKADRECYNILIAHDPTYFKDYMEWGADLVVSGHIHGGIIRLPLIGGIISPRYCLFPKYDKGLYRNEDGRSMIVSCGIGWHAIPFRFLNRPEVVAIDFVKK